MPCSFPIVYRVVKGSRLRKRGNPQANDDKMADGEQVPSKAFAAQGKAAGLTASEKAEMHKPIIFGSHQWKFKAFTALVTAGAPIALLRVFPWRSCLYITACYALPNRIDVLLCI